MANRLILQLKGDFGWCQKKTDFNEEEAIQLVITCLFTILAVDFKPTEVEIGAISKEKLELRTLTQEEIEVHLVTVAEKDS